MSRFPNQQQSTLSFREDENLGAVVLVSSDQGSVLQASLQAQLQMAMSMVGKEGGNSYGNGAMYKAQAFGPGPSFML